MPSHRQTLLLLIVIVLVLIVYDPLPKAHASSCCYRNLCNNDQTFSSPAAIDRLYPGVFRTESELGVNDCDKTCICETRCLWTSSGVTCGCETHYRWPIPWPTVSSYVPVSDAMQTTTETNRKKRDTSERCNGAMRVGSEPCVTCLFHDAPLNVLNPISGNEEPQNLHVVQINWASTKQRRYQVLYEGVCATNAPAGMCKQEHRQVTVLTSETAITKPQDLGSIVHGFKEITIKSYCRRLE